MKAIHISLFERELIKLKEEITLFKNEENIWKSLPGISNCSGNLCLHLTGNINHFIGKELGNSDYIRNRDAEFTTKSVSRKQLIAGIDQSMNIITITLSAIDENDFRKDYPVPFLGHVLDVNQVLMYLLTHLSYHLGQINYLRRILEK